MNIPKKAALQALALAAAASALAACAGPGYYDSAYGYGYDDCSGRYAGAYCGYPTFSGSVVIDGGYHRGLHYRDGRSGREYWYRDGWHRADRDNNDNHDNRDHRG